MASNEKSQQKEDEGIAITDSSHQLTSRYTLSDSSVKQLSVDRIHLQRAATFTIERYLKVFSFKSFFLLFEARSVAVE